MAFRKNPVGESTRKRIELLAEAGLAVAPRTHEVPNNTQGQSTRSTLARLVEMGLGRAESERKPLRLSPGVVRLGSQLASSGRWYDANLVRWSDGVMKPVGGWTPITNSEVGIGSPGNVSAGTPCLGTHDWAARDATHRVAFGCEPAVSGHPRIYFLKDNDFEQVNIPEPIDPTPLSGVRTYGMDNFGGDLVITMPYSGQLRYIDTSQSGVHVANVLANAPTGNVGVVVTPERYIVALGANRDANRIQWSSLADATQWDPNATGSTAGDLDLPTQGRIMAAKRSRGETLIWTETDLIALRYQGSPFTYGAFVVGRGGATSRRSMVVSGSEAYWMGRKNFWMYNGQVQRIPCPVSEHVFDNLNEAWQEVVWAEKRDEFSEITWHYPTITNVCDHYVTYNYELGVWYFGEIERSGGIDAGVTKYPVLMDNDGNLFWHENGDATGTEVPYAETGVIDVDQGLRNMYIDAIYPDAQTTGALRYKVFSADTPRGPWVEHGPFSVADEVELRIEARHLRFRVEQAAPGWRYGVPRIDARQTGER